LCPIGFSYARKDMHLFPWTRNGNSIMGLFS
jgi:hypothetical protein